MSNLPRADDPAFPAKLPRQDTRGEEAADFAFFAGLTLRDWFATHAPPVPAWFMPDQVPEQRYGANLRPLPPSASENKALAERFIAWRWHYADLMLRAREGL